jgi:hypothetical protein
MGIHDFIDFVQRNGQDIYSFHLLDNEEDTEIEEERSGSNKATIVVIPKIYSKKDILSWSLREFAKFPKIEVTYSWDDWDFKEITGYQEILMDYKNWWDATIWESSSIPGCYLVNFEPNTYNTFILGNPSPWQIPQYFLDMIFSNRGLSTPSTKELALKKIINSGNENLWEYYGFELEPLTIPQNYSTVYNEVMASPVFTNIFVYDLITPPGLSMARLAILIKDNVRSSETRLQVHTTSKTLGGETSFCEEYSSIGKSKYSFCFSPNIQTKLSNLEGCICCGSARWTGIYTCYQHQNENINKNKSIAEMRIAAQAESLCDNLESLRNIRPPATLNCSFSEKSIQYDLVLQLIATYQSTNS